MQDAVENVVAQREIIFTHRLTLEESNSCPSRPTVLYRVAEDNGHDVRFIDRRHLLQQTFKEKLRRRNYP